MLFTELLCGHSRWWWWWLGGGMITCCLGSCQGWLDLSCQKRRTKVLSHQSSLALPLQWFVVMLVPCIFSPKMGAEMTHHHQNGISIQPLQGLSHLLLFKMLQVYCTFASPINRSVSLIKDSGWHQGLYQCHIMTNNLKWDDDVHTNEE